MSPPPTSIDGTDITGATIDGQEVQEITIDGQTVFSSTPSSGLLRLTFDNADIQSGSALDTFNSNDFSINGATTGQPGLANTFNSGESISFDGNNDFLVNNSFPAFGPDWTFAFWFEGVDGSNDETFWQSDQNISNTGGNSIQFFDFGSQFGVRDPTGSTHRLTADGNVRKGSPVHVVITSSGTETNATLTLFLDGTQQNQLSGVGTINTTASHDAYIAKRKDDATFLSDSLDRFDLYDKTLSASEILNLYNTGSI